MVKAIVVIEEDGGEEEEENIISAAARLSSSLNLNVTNQQVRESRSSVNKILLQSPTHTKAASVACQDDLILKPAASPIYRTNDDEMASGLASEYLTPMNTRALTSLPSMVEVSNPNDEQDQSWASL